MVFEAGRTTVGEHLDRWLEESVKGSVKPDHLRELLPMAFAVT